MVMMMMTTIDQMGLTILVYDPHASLRVTGAISTRVLIKGLT